MFYELSESTMDSFQAPCSYAIKAFAWLSTHTERHKVWCYYQSFFYVSKQFYFVNHVTIAKGHMARSFIVLIEKLLSAILLFQRCIQLYPQF